MPGTLIVSMPPFFTRARVQLINHLLPASAVPPAAHRVVAAHVHDADMTPALLAAKVRACRPPLERGTDTASSVLRAVLAQQALSRPPGLLSRRGRRGAIASLWREQVRAASELKPCEPALRERARASIAAWERDVLAAVPAYTTGASACPADSALGAARRQGPVETTGLSTRLVDGLRVQASPRRSRAAARPRWRRCGTRLAAGARLRRSQRRLRRRWRLRRATLPRRLRLEAGDGGERSCAQRPARCLTTKRVAHWIQWRQHRLPVHLPGPAGDSASSCKSAEDPRRLTVLKQERPLSLAPAQSAPQAPCAPTPKPHQLYWRPLLCSSPH